jgi:hypothetical protein
MVYHNNSTGVGGNKNKFSLLETIKNARNKKREKRQREMFCLETACTLMEASYQAYFPLPLSVPLPLPLSPPSLSVPITSSAAGPEESTYVESSSKRGSEAVEGNGRVIGVETGTPSGERKREEENIEEEGRKVISLLYDAETDRHSLTDPSAHPLAAIASTTSPTQAFPSSSARTDRSSFHTPHTPSSPPPAVEPSVEPVGADEIPTSDPRSLLPPTKSPPTENRTHESLRPCPSPPLSSSPSPILSLSDPVLCLEDDGTTHAAHTHQLSDKSSTAPIPLSGEQAKKEEEMDEEKKEKLSKKEQKTVKNESDPSVESVNPPIPIGVDNRVLGPKMDLPRIGLRLLSFFENREHATFGFVATTPLPPAFGPLKGKNEY